MRVHTQVQRVALVLSLAAIVSVSASEAQYDAYIWQYPLVTEIGPAADPLRQLLRDEVQSILDAGHLRPLRTFNGDQFAASGYFLYWERGRIVTTLAWAWPHLTTTQQSAVIDYVRAELSNPAYAPWVTTPRHLSPTSGVAREPYPTTTIWNWDTFWNQDGDTRPITPVLYGLWLYAYRTGDWSVVTDNWAAIKAFYIANLTEANHYGAMGAHLAMARMAERENDVGMRTQAVSNANQQFTAGLDFNAQETRAASAYAPMYESRRASQLYLGFMFLNLTPEVGRFLKDQIAAPVLARNAAGKEAYPGWYLLNAAYFTYWTGGDEGNGIPIEIMGMIPPVERWVAETPAPTLASWTRSAPGGRGDCYWLEALVQAIEANGTLTWYDVRNVVAVDPPRAEAELRLESVLPNPARTRVTFRLLGSTGATLATLRVFDPAGREVARPLDRQTLSGRHEIQWAGEDRDGRPLPSGIYLCRLECGGRHQQARIVLTR